MKRIRIGRLLLSLLGAIFTLLIAWGVSRLPYSTFRDRVDDFLTLPGALIARVFYPAGVHTGSGAPHWGDLVLWGNVATYTVLWFAVLTVINRWSGRRRGQPPASAFGSRT